MAAVEPPAQREAGDAQRRSDSTDPQTEAVRGKDAPVAPKDNMLPDLAEDKGWSFDIARLRVADSVLVFQHEDDEQVTVRDIRLEMEQDSQHRGTFDFPGV